MRLDFLGAKKPQVIPWGKRPKTPQSEPDLHDEQALENQKPPLSIWKIAAFFLVVAGLVFYAKRHWPTIAPVMLVGDGAEAGYNLSQSEDYFIEFRLDREKTETEQIDMLRKVIDDPKASKETRDAAYTQYLSVADIMGKQAKIEGVLKAKGLDSLVFLSPDSCTVVVKAKELEQKEVTQIGDTVKKIGKTKLENITIIPVGN